MVCVCVCVCECMCVCVCVCMSVIINCTYYMYIVKHSHMDIIHSYVHRSIRPRKEGGVPWYMVHSFETLNTYSHSVVF